MAGYEHYQPSGHFGAATLGLGLTLGAISAVALGVSYQLVLDSVAFVYVNFLATLSLGAGLGWVVARALRQGKCRSVPLAVVIGAFAGLVAEVAAFEQGYRHFTADAVASNQQSLQQLEDELTHGELTADERRAVQDLVRMIEATPLTTEGLRAEYSFSQFLADRAQTGWIVGPALPVAGTWVWLLWIAEALVVLGLTVGFAVREARKPFCETCDAWCARQHLTAIPGVSAAALQRASADRDLRALLTPDRDLDTAERAEYRLHVCPRCPEPAYLSVDLAWEQRDKRGAVTGKRRRPLVEYAAVTREQLGQLGEP